MMLLCLVAQLRCRTVGPNGARSVVCSDSSIRWPEIVSQIAEHPVTGQALCLIFPVSCPADDHEPSSAGSSCSSSRLHGVRLHRPCSATKVRPPSGTICIMAHIFAAPCQSMVIFKVHSSGPINCSKNVIMDRTAELTGHPRVQGGWSRWRPVRQGRCGQ